MGYKQKRRHHYVPVAYLKEFSDASGRIFAYRKDEPDMPLHVKPDEIAFENYYYSQPLPNNAQDNNAIEDFFGTIETLWPSAVRSFEKRKPSTHSDLTAFFQFLGLMRVRVPASRDMFEALLAESVKAFAKKLDRQGKLAPKPPGLEDILEHLSVAIDPHKSIHAMADLALGFSKIVDQLGFAVIRNKTEHLFITSDNPVAYYDPDISETARHPYDVKPRSGRIELLFPISPQLLVMGRTEWKYQFSASGVHYYDLFDKQEAKRINRQTARFGYRFLFSKGERYRALTKKYAALSPVLRTRTVPSEKGEALLFQSVFGKRTQKPKWMRPPNQTFEPSS